MSVKIGGVDMEELASFMSEYLAKPAFQYKIPKQALMIAIEEYLISQGAKFVQVNELPDKS